MTAMKSTRWSFTAYEGQYPTIDALTKEGDPLIAEIGYQDEICPDTGRKHRQGYIRTVRQVRFKQLADILKGVHLEVARDFNALKQYCAKAETRDPTGKQVSEKFERPMRLHEIMESLAHTAWDIYEEHRQTDSHPLNHPDIKEQYRTLASELLLRKPDYISIIAQPIAKNAWFDFRAVWVSRAKRAREEAEGGNSITPPGTPPVSPAPTKVNVGDIVHLHFDENNVYHEYNGPEEEASDEA